MAAKLAVYSAMKTSVPLLENLCQLYALLAKNTHQQVLDQKLRQASEL